jgi:tetratricopeptide (TPR) repeat protein
MRGTRALAVVIVAAATQLFDPGTASAGMDRARALGIEGHKVFNEGRYQEALRLFEAAYGEYAWPTFLFNMAQAYRKLEQCETARYYYKRYLQLDPEGYKKTSALAMLDELEAKCPSRKKSGDARSTSP